MWLGITEKESEKHRRQAKFRLCLAVKNNVFEAEVLKLSGQAEEVRSDEYWD
jgi:hypothetical protein